tara:strand:- start:444 stop:995 length:552 start_codon:yes stop_codon:yes gene_type:complete
MHISRQFYQAFILGIIGASGGIYMYSKIFNNKPTYIIGEVHEMFLPAKLLSRKIHVFVEQTIEILKKNKTGNAYEEIRENVNTIGNRVVLWNEKGIPMVCTKYNNDTSSHDGELELIEHDYEQSIEDMPDPILSDELKEWEKIAKKGGGWCVHCGKSHTNYIKYECIYVKKHNNVYVTCGYSI